MKRTLALALAATLGTLEAAAPPPPARASKILSPTFFPGWQARGVFHPFVLHDPTASRYRLYYSGKGTVQIGDAVSDTWVTGVATSRDRLAWTYPDDYEPVLLSRRFLEGDVVDRDSQSSVFDSLFAFAACVLKDGATYRMWYTGWNGDTTPHDAAGRVERTHFRIGHAISRDGLSWKKQEGTAGGGAVVGLGGAADPDARSAAHPSVLRDESSYRMWYECDDGNTRRICAAHSSDGLSWKKSGPVLEPGGPGSPDERGAGDPVVIRRQGRYELWYQGRARGNPTYRILRATSSDGTRWTKTGAVALHPQPPVTDDEAIHVGSVLVKADGACQVFFAKEITTTRALAFGKVDSKSFHIYTESVRP